MQQIRKVVQHFTKITTRFSLQNVSNMNGREYAKSALLFAKSRQGNLATCLTSACGFPVSAADQSNYMAIQTQADTLIFFSSVHSPNFAFDISCYVITQINIAEQCSKRRLSLIYRTFCSSYLLKYLYALKNNAWTGQNCTD